MKREADRGNIYERNMQHGDGCLVAGSLGAWSGGVSPVRMLASSSWLGWLASLMLDEADEKRSLAGECVAALRSASSSEGTEASDVRSPARSAHHPPHAERRFGLYRGGPRNGTTRHTNKKK